jgi:pimeloyl-ACP methyl ester carboxylesterase
VLVAYSFFSYDRTRLTYRRSGTGRPLVCLPGGPGRVPDYLGDLGGLRGRELIFLELRGTGTSAVPADPATYRCDRMVDDVEALRVHLGLDQVELLGHSAGGDLAMLYAARYPDLIERLILITPALYAVGMAVTAAELVANTERRSAEPWYPQARAAVDAAVAGDESTENTRRYLPFFYGRWDDQAMAHAAGEARERTPAVAAGYYAEGAFDPPQTRSLLGKVISPVLVYAGEVDLAPVPGQAAEAAVLFPDGQTAVQPGAGHFPWVDDPQWFAGAVGRFLD